MEAIKLMKSLRDNPADAKIVVEFNDELYEVVDTSWGGYEKGGFLKLLVNKKTELTECADDVPICNELKDLPIFSNMTGRQIMSICNHIMRIRNLNQNQ